MKLKDIIKENSILVSPISTIKPIGDMGPRSQVKMTDLVKEEEQTEERQIDTQAFLGMVNRFGRIGEEIKVNDLRGIANVLKNVAETAKIHTESLQEDWFDKVTVTRNMKELNNYSKQFSKIAQEASSLQERMRGLYEDMGNIMGRYYEINEELTEDDDYDTFFQSALNRFDENSVNEDRNASILQHQERELEKALKKGDEDEIYTLRNAIAYTKSKMK